jgi:adenylylsulfate kinase-like enzyme
VPPRVKPRILVFIGLPGSGKTTIAQKVAKKLKAVHVNADFVRSTITSNLGFSLADRKHQAKSLGSIARIVAEAGHLAVVDFVCPTFDTRFEFKNALGYDHQDAVWFEVYRENKHVNYENTTKLYESMSDWVAENNKNLLVIKHFKSLINNDESVANIVSQALSFYENL